MRLVLDSSIAAKWVLPESDAAKALALRDDIRKNVHEVLAPDVFPIEVGHALTRAERQGRVSQADGLSLWTEVMKDCPQLFASLPLMPKAYALSSQTRIGIYDALYLRLSEEEQCKMVSADNRLITLFPSQVISLSLL